MKVLNLIILLQQLENYKNFQYNNHMKSKEEIKKLAKEIADLEMQIKNQDKDKIDQSVYRKIENIITNLTLEEGLELNDAVIEIIENT